MADLEDDDDHVDMQYDEPAPMQAVPTELKVLRACIPCMLIKTLTQFVDNGCENCPWLGREPKPQDYTTANFQGMISLMQPGKSWVAKWQRTTKMVPGCYAVKVNEEVHAEVAELIKENGVNNLGKLSMEESN